MSRVRVIPAGVVAVVVAGWLRALTVARAPPPRPSARRAAAGMRIALRRQMEVFSTSSVTVWRVGSPSGVRV